jgi:hypothetical protein
VRLAELVDSSSFKFDASQKKNESSLWTTCGLFVHFLMPSESSPDLILARTYQKQSQDRRRLSRFTRRWLVERFFAWIQWQRRILVRWEFHTQNFLGFVQLACLVILFRQF